MKKIITTNLLLLLCHFSFAQLSSISTIDTSVTAFDLVQDDLLGAGISVSNVTTNVSLGADPRQFARFTNANSALGIGAGVMLCTGYTEDFNSIGNTGGGFTSISTVPSCFSGLCGPSDADLNNLVPPFSTFDAAVLEFDFVSVTDTVLFRYTFASEEYPEYACSDFNDVFGFFVTGPGYPSPTNIATILGTNPPLPVAINTINPGIPGANAWVPHQCVAPNGSLAYPSLYVDNAVSSTLQFDGLTVVLEAVVPVVSGQTYHIKLSIADVGDGNFDSAVFLEQASFGSTWFNQIRPATPQGNIIVENCNTQSIEFEIPKAVDSTVIIPLNIFGTAANGVDYVNILDTLVILQGSTTAQLNFESILDTIAENAETVFIAFQHTRSVFDTVEFTIVDFLTNVIDNGNGSATANVLSGGSGNYSYQWDANASNQNTQTAFGLQTGTYYVTITDNVFCQKVDSVSVLINALTNLHAEDIFSISPNPNKGFFNLELHSKDIENASFKIVNTLGQEILQQQISNTKEPILIDFKEPSLGVYYLIVEAGGKAFVQKIVKE